MTEGVSSLNRRVGSLLATCQRRNSRGQKKTAHPTYLCLLFSMACLLGAGSNDLRDPTAPSDWAGSSDSGHTGTAGYIVSSLLVSPKRKLAVVNQKTVREGDEIGGQRVVRISMEGVVLKGIEGELRTIKMFTQPIKR